MQVLTSGVNKDGWLVYVVKRGKKASIILGTHLVKKVPLENFIWTSCSKALKEYPKYVLPAPYGNIGVQRILSHINEL